MSFCRILLFTVLLLVLRVVVEAVFSVSAPEGALSTSLVWELLLRRYLPDAVVVLSVLTVLARVQAQWPYVHALCVIILHEFLAATLMRLVGWDLPASPFWRLDYVVLLVSAVIGTEIGRRLRSRAERQRLPA